jgi:O-antigen ligase
VTRTQRTYVVAAAVAAIVTAANASQGAYFSQSWGWVALAFLVPATVLLILDRVEAPGRMRLAFAALMVAFAAWVALSAVWSISAPASLREVERILVYVAVALAVAFVLRRGDGPAVLAGIVVGATLICAYAAATRLLPDRFDVPEAAVGGHRLSTPLGYWNALGLLASMGCLIAAGFVAHGRRKGWPLAAAAAIPVLTTTLYFTFSRGSWAALFIGFGVAVGLDPRRLRVVWTSLIVALPSIACIAYASRLEALTQEDAPAFAAERDGHRLAAILVGCVACSVAAALAARWLAKRLPVTPRTRRYANVGLATIAGAAVIVVLVAVGGPSSGFDDLRDRFSAEPELAGWRDLNDRLFSISGNGRAEQLRVSWDAGREHPLAGAGSGTFEYLWYRNRNRPTTYVVRDGHSLYLETFAETGVIGLGLLFGAVSLLLLAGFRARRVRFVAFGVGAFVGWMAASGFDWHWEVVGVTMTAFLAGSAGLCGGERRANRGLSTPWRGGLILATVALSVAATWSLVGNQALFAGREALAREEWRAARDHGLRARALLFWSAEPDIVLGDAAAGLGDRDTAVKDYRAAVESDPQSWVAWLRLAQVSRGAERASAYRRVHELNPREQELPGE